MEDKCSQHTLDWYHHTLYHASPLTVVHSESPRHQTSTVEEMTLLTPGYCSACKRVPPKDLRKSV